jgi:hypothetical protein
MHIFIYLISALGMVGGIFVASELQSPISIIVFLQCLFGAVILATFGRMEEHLGDIRNMMRARGGSIHFQASNDGDLASTSVGVVTDRHKESSSSSKSGFIGKRAYRTLDDGSVELDSLIGSKVFPDVESAREYVLGRQR